jgi:hypothetical protein
MPGLGRWRADGGRGLRAKELCDAPQKGDPALFGLESPEARNVRKQEPIERCGGGQRIILMVLGLACVGGCYEERSETNKLRMRELGGRVRHVTALQIADGVEVRVAAELCGNREVWLASVGAGRNGNARAEKEKQRGDREQLHGVYLHGNSRQRPNVWHQRRA